MTRDELLAAIEGVKPNIVPVTFCGRDVYVGEMSGSDGETLGKDQADAAKAGTYFSFRSAVIVRSLCDETGKRLLTDADTAVVEKAKLSEINRVWTAAAKINALLASDQTDEKKE